MEKEDSSIYDLHLKMHLEFPSSLPSSPITKLSCLSSECFTGYLESRSLF